MKNIYVLPTDKPSRLFKHQLDEITLNISKHLLQRNYGFNTYITSDEEIKDGEYGICLNLVREGFKSHQVVFKMDAEQRQAMNELGGQKKAEVLKVILTTNQYLIKDGVQAIPDDFLEWFVKNPNCEFVETQYHYETICDEGDYTINPAYWTIIIPKEEPYERTTQSISLSEVDKEEPKQETLEEVAERLYPNYQQEIFIKGAKWQAERMFSEEDMREAFENGVGSGKYQAEYGDNAKGSMNFEYFIEQFKKK